METSTGLLQRIYCNTTRIQDKKMVRDFYWLGPKALWAASLLLACKFPEELDCSQQRICVNLFMLQTLSVACQLTQTDMHLQQIRCTTLFHLWFRPVVWAKPEQSWSAGLTNLPVTVEGHAVLWTQWIRRGSVQFNNGSPSASSQFPINLSSMINIQCLKGIHGILLRAEWKTALCTEPKIW